MNTVFSDTFAEVATQFSAQLGKTVTYVDRPVEQVVSAMKSRGMPDSIADSFGKMMEAFAAGAAAEMTTAVQELTGRDPHTFNEFLADNIEAFR